MNTSVYSIYFVSMIPVCVVHYVIFFKLIGTSRSIFGGGKGVAWMIRSAEIGRQMSPGFFVILSAARQVVLTFYCFFYFCW